MRKHLILIILVGSLFPISMYGQVDEDKLGAWYMYFWNTTFSDSKWGLQGDAQHRNWNMIGDLEQLLLRGGLTYQPNNTRAILTLGYANITTGTFGDSKDTRLENRIYQEALLPQKIGERVYLRHRFRFEQRFVEDQNTRTRWRYAIFLSIPLNQADMGKGAIYIAFYNELFVNGQRDIGNGRSVEIYDRNRAYGALGYSLSNKLKVQFGFMQQNSDSIGKGQMQLSLHHAI
jgi:hypothetical protein